MKSSRKWLALFTVAVVLMAAGSALAYGGRGGRGGMPCGGGPQWGPGGGYQGMQGPGPRGMRYGGYCFDGPFSSGGNYIDIPQAIRDKQVEADKLLIDLRAELSRPQIDRAKTLEVWKKHRALRDEIAEWSFTQRLEWMTNRPYETAPVSPQQNTPQ